MSTPSNIPTVKNKLRLRFCVRVMVARLAPSPHGGRILTEEPLLNMQKHSSNAAQKLVKKCKM